MGINFKSLVSLKIQYIIAFIVIWNAGFLLAMQLGGGGLQGGLSSIGMLLTGIVCLAASAFSFAVATSISVQTVVVDPERKKDFTTKEFYILAVITGLIGISRFVFPAI